MLDEQARIGRRAFLALGTSTVLGGCIQNSAPGGRETTRATATQDEPTATASGEAGETNRPETEPATTERGGPIIGIDSDRSEPQATTIISDGTDGNESPEDWITVWNDADTARRITVTVKEKGTSDSPLFRETYRFKPDAYVKIGVSKPGEYVVSVAVDGGESTTIEFMADWCNVQSLYIIVKESGTIQSSGFSTMVGCMTISVPQTETTTTDG